MIDEDLSSEGCFRRAVSGAAGRPCVGVTFLPDEPVESLAWGEARRTPLLTAVCSRIAPDFAFVPSWDADAGQLCSELLECGTDPLWVIRGPFDTVASDNGWDRALRWSVSDPAELAHRLDEAVAEMVALVSEGAMAGAEAIVIAEDVAGADGPLMAPDFVISELMPRFGAVVAAAAEEARAVVWHSDGDIRPFLSAAARADIDAVHPGGLGIELFGEVFAAARGAGLAVLGGVPGEVLRQGGPAAMRAGVAAGVLAAGGGLLVCDDGGVSTGEELGMLVMALQAARGGPDQESGGSGVEPGG